MTNALHEASEALRGQAWKTQQARLSAHRRLLVTHQASTFAIAVSSVYVIGMSVATLIIDADSAYHGWLSWIGLVSATAILALSLIEGSQRYELRAERLHDCALELGALLGEIDVFQANGSTSSQDFKELRARYDTILRTHKENHTPLDYAHFQATRSNHFPEQKTYRRWITLIRWNSGIYWRFAIALLGPPALAIAAFASA